METSVWPAIPARPPGFNGATAKQLWKHAVRTRLQGGGGKLQWGHSQTAVETRARMKQLVGATALQWGHSQTAVETVSAPGPHPRQSGFNGATAKQLWKHSSRDRAATRCSRFNGATAKQLWKLVTLGVLVWQTIRFNGATAKQLWKLDLADAIRQKSE